MASEAPLRLAPVSVVIITRDEEEHVEDCLRSVLWADDIVVVDSESHDRTVAICRKFTRRVYVRPWPGFAAQKAFALQLARHRWVLSLDADERVSVALREEILSLMHSGPDCDGYFVPRRSAYLGKWIRHCGWYPGYQLRFFRKRAAAVTPVRVHEGFLITGRVGYMKGELLHLSYEDLEEHLDKINRYSTLEAMDRAPRVQAGWHHFLLHPLSEFLRKFVVLKGALEGTHGLVLATMSAFQKMVLYMKMWQLQHRQELLAAYQQAGAPRSSLELGD